MDGASLVQTPDGTRDKYIGLALAISSSIAIGTSLSVHTAQRSAHCHPSTHPRLTPLVAPNVSTSIITKKGLISAADRHDGLSSSATYSYLKNGLWWAGMITMVAGEVANFAAYCFAPPILVTPLGAGSVLVGAVLASFFLGEQLGRIGISGCSLCLVGSLIIVLHAPEDKAIETVDEVLAYALQPGQLLNMTTGFLFYCFFVIVFSVYMIYRVAPVSGSSNPLVYISICSLVGSVSVMAVKGFGVALKLTIAGNNQLWRPGTWVFAITVVGCIAVQMNYFNKALDLFPTTVVNPSYFVGFSTSTLIASIILFHGLNTSGGKDTLSLLCGLYVISLGVYLLNLSRSENENSSGGLTRLNRYSHSMLDNGILGRTSLASNRYSMNSEVDGNPDARKSTNFFRGGGAVVGGVEPMNHANDLHLPMEEFEEDFEEDDGDDGQGTTYPHKGKALNGTR
ncbi:BZ3500_MvSof-1268-A1-R1_Chr1-3g02123 [Microbotryum saponariae]|uniref:BZ3500_MvSof-1268-A1-R1_Chr1-3g02123 protein n=1 Tax=Microbotryum saponariae TaxID=289078 RepID=A0A2X0KGC7_9BASI|nr:BZ3500_MvSof-1268-A1-R1_Chr1-3g02123 [Microbotryum saponariae]SCZ95448.1 BZ3501_MvSof-1269-A2-R1_Chr1-3g01725 [Microbotryum saponariae]